MSAPPVTIDFENDAFAEGIPHETFRWLRDERRRCTGTTGRTGAATGR